MLYIDGNGVLRHRDDELMHHGVKGMKWGVRRYQNKDGSLTAAGKKRYTDGELSKFGRVKLRLQNAYAIDKTGKIVRKQAKLSTKDTEKAKVKIQKLEAKKAKLQELMKKSVSTLSQEEIQRGMKEYQTAKAVGKGLMHIGVAALIGSAGYLVGDIVNNGGIGVREAVTRTIDGQYANRDDAVNFLTKLNNSRGGNASIGVTSTTREAFYIGRWAIGGSNLTDMDTYMDDVDTVINDMGSYDVRLYNR